MRNDNVEESIAVLVINPRINKNEDGSEAYKKSVEVLRRIESKYDVYGLSVHILNPITSGRSLIGSLIEAISTLSTVSPDLVMLSAGWADDPEADTIHYICNRYGIPMIYEALLTEGSSYEKMIGQNLHDVGLIIKKKHEKMK